MARTGRLHTGTGQFSYVGGPTTVVDAASNAVFAVSAGDEPQVVRVADGDLTIVGPAASEDGSSLRSVSGIWDFLAVDPVSGTIWVTGEGADAIAKMEPDSGRQNLYRLPSYESPVFSRCAEDLDVPCTTKTVIKTRVRGLAVANDGGLWFSDATRNRIGFISSE